MCFLDTVYFLTCIETAAIGRIEVLTAGLLGALTITVFCDGQLPESEDSLEIGVSHILDEVYVEVCEGNIPENLRGRRDVAIELYRIDIRVLKEIYVQLLVEPSVVEWLEVKLRHEYH